MSTVVFAGCSFTAGNGWIAPPKDNPYATIECKDYPGLWVNLCHRHIDQLKELTLINIGRGGGSNTEIFENTIRTLSEHTSNIKYLFVQWTSMPRYNFNTGLELWNTTEKLHGAGHHPTHNIKLSNGSFWDREYLTDLLSRLRVLHHLHPEIVKVVSYSKIISNLCKKFNIKVVFINGICPWDDNYFVRSTGNTPENYTPFTKKEILDIDHRDDEVIFKLYEKIHNDYDSAGGINTAEWVNLYHSMKNNKLDTNYDNDHPGIKSNQLYFQQIKNFLETH